MIYLNLFWCSCLLSCLDSSNSRASSFILTLWQGGRFSRAASPGLGTANRANASNVAGLLGCLGSLWSGGSGFKGENAILISDLLETRTLEHRSLTEISEMMFRFSVIPIYSTHLYVFIGLFCFPLGPSSFWFVSLLPCAFNTPYNLHTALFPIISQSYSKHVFLLNSRFYFVHVSCSFLLLIWLSKQRHYQRFFDSNIKNTRSTWKGIIEILGDAKKRKK